MSPVGWGELANPNTLPSLTEPAIATFIDSIAQNEGESVGLLGFASSPQRAGQHAAQAWPPRRGEGGDRPGDRLLLAVRPCGRTVESLGHPG
ncbi:hypothetical protein ACCAA_20207 [Candidatus Accumulibacter aalborgensis]|uniref:Uncharacterized protein n=1 Tax=Candidatus Accumulibacter aalborgensis TaxID=1860102 RepID=A0A1A8XJ10_9PROT|nr:hypothetical protein ACCAA_20207 [Candidatus Accumulibacter aalborgensis]